MELFTWETPIMRADFCYFDITKYSTGAKRIQIFGVPENSEDGALELIETVTISLPFDEVLLQNQIILKDYAENTGTLVNLIRMGIITSRDNCVDVGYAYADICTINVAELEKHTY